MPNRIKPNIIAQVRKSGVNFQVVLQQNCTERNLHKEKPTYILILVHLLVLSIKLFIKVQT